jgi:Lrp/AsnC family leucine-responsive transcriptional regulator
MQLLAALQKNARATYGELGAEAGLSQSSVYERLRKLEARGVITGYRAVVNPEALGLCVTAFVSVITSGSCAVLAGEVEEFPEVEEFHSVAGETCALLKVRTTSTSALQEFLDRLRSLGSVERTNSTIVLQTRFERAAGESLQAQRVAESA